MFQCLLNGGLSILVMVRLLITLSAQNWVVSVQEQEWGFR